MYGGWVCVFFLLLMIFSAQLQRRDDKVDTGTIAGKGDWHELWCISAQSPCF